MKIPVCSLFNPKISRCLTTQECKKPRFIETDVQQGELILCPDQSDDIIIFNLQLFKLITLLQ